MRDIKFRGLTKDGEWVYGYYLVQNGRGVDGAKDDSIHQILDSGGSMQLVIPETAGQYTGLKDKNGTEIFDGDVVTYDGVDRDSSYCSRESNVEFQDGCLSPFYEGVGDSSGVLYHTEIIFESVKITGNIHQQ